MHPPRIFISATSGDLHSVRPIVKKATALITESMKSSIPAGATSYLTTTSGSLGESNQKDSQKKPAPWPCRFFLPEIMASLRK